MRSMTRQIRLWLALCSIVFITSLGFAQSSNSGDIRGTVTDASGAIIPDAKVTVKNVDTGVTHVYITDPDGIYDTASTLPGNYEITFTKDGFQQLTRGPITLGATIITVDGHMVLGEVSQQIVVTGDASQLQTEAAEQSTTLEYQSLVQLPQVGQDWSNLVVTLPGTSGRQTANPGIGVSVNGNLPFYSNFLSDGVSVTLPHSANLDTATFETLAEVKIDTSTFSAQYGIGGAVFNQITKSGSNAWHGAAYEYFQNDALNARSYFDAPNQAIPKLRYDNYGGAVSGPVRKNKMFAYFNLDRTANHSQHSGFVTLPTDDERDGKFEAILGGPVLDASKNPVINPCTGDPVLENQIFDPSTQTTVNGQVCRFPFAHNEITKLDQVAKNLQQYYPSSNRPGLSNNYYYLSPATSTAQRLFGKIDYDLSQKNRLTGTVVERNTNQPTQSEFPCPINCQWEDFTDYSGRISDVWTISNSVVNRGLTMDSTGKRVCMCRGRKGWEFPTRVGLKYAKADMLPQIAISGGVGTCCRHSQPKHSGNLRAECFPAFRYRNLDHRETHSELWR